ncbi:hypothetical protein D3877_28380 [Azospirillum cavernae]|uniref:Chitooligosaccharide deacetylase n=1 Tax=Azospirillum cavernae TaxID=2320860 RepID=A0A418VL05_9PROT|nr:polysaccharide deacetylase family protein [Azospirillum cavernae]RJF76804.1 hypothetical protein D3877_28380 [Azospirillum cavernae]
MNTNKTGQWSQRLGDGTLCIFLFHGVVSESPWDVRNYTGKHRLKSEFRAILEDLKRSGTPLSMDDVIHHQQTGEPYPSRAFAITFDDGFENNLTVAAPELDRLGIPATFYITTGFIEDNAMSWIDRIEWALERTLIGSLCLPWRTGAISFATRAERIALLTEIRRFAKKDRSIDPQALASDIQAQCDLPETWSGDNALDQKMNWDQVRMLADNPLFIVGGHSHRHDILSFLEPDALAVELETSVRLMRDRAGLSCRHYSYPEGLAHCYSDAVIEALRGHGVVCCPTAEDGDNTPETGLFHLKRIMVG